MDDGPGQVPNGRKEQNGALKWLYHEPDEVRLVVAQLFGVSADLFLNAVGHAWLEWANRTQFDPPSGPGELLWIHTVRHERRQFSELDPKWIQDDAGNFSSMISPDGRVAIAVETGNRMTGAISHGKYPRTNSKKGPRTMQMVRDNRAIIQGDAFTGFPTPKAPNNPGAPLLWIHLIHQSRGHILHELSLPLTSDLRNKIVGWRCRIILPQWTGGDLTGIRAPEPAAEPEVRINRRVG